MQAGLGGDFLAGLGNGPLQRGSLPDDQDLGLFRLETFLDGGFFG
jgi:hypothetical protein